MKSQPIKSGGIIATHIGNTKKAIKAAILGTPKPALVPVTVPANCGHHIKTHG
jgi:hypothetical protein